MCKEWLAKYEKVEDVNDLQAVQGLIEEATDSLGFVLEEFTQLKEDHYESLVKVKKGFEVIFDQGKGK